MITALQTVGRGVERGGHRDKEDTNKPFTARRCEFLFSCWCSVERGWLEESGEGEEGLGGWVSASVVL